MNILRKNWVVMLVGGLVLVGALRLLAAEGINRASPAPVEVKPMPEVSEFKPAPIDLYDADPQHLWNRLHSVLFVRKDAKGALVGVDDIDPPVMAGSTYLFEQSRLREALATMDEFIKQDGAKLIQDPVKRAFLQHDLWTLFDVLGNAEDGTIAFNSKKKATDLITPTDLETLRRDVVHIMRAVALTPNEISHLGDNLMQAMDAGVIPKAVDPANPNAAYLTPEIRRENSAWVGIETHGGTVTASEHNERTGGRYAFAVLLRMPEGRNAAINFIQKLGATPLEELQRAFSGRPTPRGTPGSRAPAPVMPKVEAGTQFAILRQMMVIDNTGHLVGTPITLSVEVRTFGPELQESFADFYVQRRLLLAGKAGGMVRRGPLEAANSDEFFNFEGLPVDSPAGGPRPTPVLQSCLRCHGLNPSVFPTLFNVLPYPSQIDTQSSPLPEFKQTAAFKSHRQEWGQLNQYWPNLVPVPMKVSIVRGPAISPIK